MMKKLKYSFSLIFIVSIVASCGNEGWSRSDKSKLTKQCRLEGGSRSYCNCYLENAMKAYPAAEDMEDIKFEKAVELSIDCK